MCADRWGSYCHNPPPIQRTGDPCPAILLTVTAISCSDSKMSQAASHTSSVHFNGADGNSQVLLLRSVSPILKKKREQQGTCVAPLNLLLTVGIAVQFMQFTRPAENKHLLHRDVLPNLFRSAAKQLFKTAVLAGCYD